MASVEYVFKYFFVEFVLSLIYYPGNALYISCTEWDIITSSDMTMSSCLSRAPLRLLEALVPEGGVGEEPCASAPVRRTRRQ